MAISSKGGASFTFHAKSGGWFDFHGRSKIKRALEQAGEAYKEEMSNYPAQPPVMGLRGTYGRTGHLARSLRTTISMGIKTHTLDMRGPKYAEYLLVGTGIYGPRRRMITPKSGRVLAWRVTRGVHPLYGKFATAFAVKGTKWEGKAEKLKRKVIAAFRKGVASR